MTNSGVVCACPLEGNIKSNSVCDSNDDSSDTKRSYKDGDRFTSYALVAT